jgi:hypothetical protein
MGLRNLAIFTICSNNRVPSAKVLLQSVRRHHPDASLYLCLADKRPPDAACYPPDCELIAAEDLGIPDFLQFAFRYVVLEFNTAVKPFVIRALLERGHDAVLHFDADIEVFAPLDGILQRLENGASFVLTPHLLQPAEGGAFPDDVGIMLAGAYNLGFLGVGSTAEVPPIIDWWARRLRYQCVIDQARGLFVDQRFIDLLPGFADHVHVLRDPRYNVAYWNLAQRRLMLHGDEWQIDGALLGFFHFSGFDCARQELLSQYTTAFRGDDISEPLAALLRHHASQVLSHGYRKARRIPYAYGCFASGAPISDQARRVFRTQYTHWRGNPFTHWPGNPFTHFQTDVPPIDPAAVPMMTAEEMMSCFQAIYASTSWRITRPLRSLRRLLSG